MQGEASQTPDRRRAAFLDGEDTLTLREVREWARELVPFTTASPPVGMPDDEPLMVSIVHQPNDTRGLANPTIIRGVGV